MMSFSTSRMTAQIQNANRPLVIWLRVSPAPVLRSAGPWLRMSGWKLIHIARVHRAADRVFFKAKR